MMSLSTTMDVKEPEAVVKRVKGQIEVPRDDIRRNECLFSMFMGNES